MSETENQEELNRQTINSLKKGGSNLSKPHQIEHHFYCSREDACIKLIEKGETLGYHLSNEGQVETDGNIFYFDLIKSTVLTLETMNKETQLMIALANEFSSDYDGWGCEIVE